MKKSPGKLTHASHNLGVMDDLRAAARADLCITYEPIYVAAPSE